MKCFYHTDLDGQCSAAIVRAFHGPEVECRPINYKDDFPFGDIVKDELVIIVDFSLQKPGEFDRLLGITDWVIWIDHHKSAIEGHPELKYLAGVRESGIAACELTWRYFHPGEDVPLAVKLIGDYDVWRFQFGEDTNRFQAGARLHDTRPDAPIWRLWLSPDSGLINELTEGAIALQYRNHYYQGLARSWSFETEFEGYRGIACNAGSVSSQLFDTVKNGFDLMIPFVFDGKQWTVSLYTENPNIDVSELAKKHGGGGHQQAAGFQCRELPFVRTA